MQTAVDTGFQLDHNLGGYLRSVVQETLEHRSVNWT